MARRSASLVCPIVLFLFPSSSALLAAMPDIDRMSVQWEAGWRQPEDIAAWKSRKQAIETELAQLAAAGDHEWAGEYFHGDGAGLNVTLMLAPKNGFCLQWVGQYGVYDVNFGDVSRDEGGMLRLTFACPHDLRGTRRADEDMLVINVKGRHYLVAERDMPAFVDGLNSCWEPRPTEQGELFLRRGDEDIIVLGIPRLPAPYDGMVRRDPISGLILEATAPDRVSTPSWAVDLREAAYEVRLVISLGTSKGARPGTALFGEDATTHGPLVGDIEVISASEEESQAVYRIGVNESDEQDWPAVGTKVYASPDYFRARCVHGLEPE